MAIDFMRNPFGVTPAQTPVQAPTQMPTTPGASEKNQKLALMLYALGGALRGDKNFVQNTLQLQQMQEGKKKQKKQEKNYQDFLKTLDPESPFYDLAKSMGSQNLTQLLLERYKTSVPKQLTPSDYKARILEKIASGKKLTAEDQRVIDFLQKTDPIDIAIRENLRNMPGTPTQTPTDTQEKEIKTYASKQDAINAGLKSGDQFYGTDGNLYQIP